VDVMRVLFGTNGKRVVMKLDRSKGVAMESRAPENQSIGELLSNRKTIQMSQHAKHWQW
jgi:hypothetical protein